MNTLRGWLVGLGICLGLMPSAQGDPFDALREHWREYLIAGGGHESRGSIADLEDRASRGWSSMNTNANRTNLFAPRAFGGNRFGTNRSTATNRPAGSNRAFGANSAGATVSRGFSTLESMALAWATPGCSLYGNTNLAAAIDSGLDWMAANVYSPDAYESDNWYYWEIDGPKNFDNAAMLMYPTLTTTEISNYCASIDGHSPGGLANTYGWQSSANTVDMAMVMFIRGILGKDAGRMAIARTNLSTVFACVTTGDGFYADGSYVFHTDKAYTGGYGVELLDDLAMLGNMLSNSPWQITTAEKTTLFNWVSNSYEPLLYNGAMMDMVRGREISRASATEITNGQRAISAIRQIARFAPPATAAAFSNFANAPLLPPGQFQFAGMDRVVALRNGFAVGLSMSSARIANYESIHNENLHGWFTGDGMTYLYLGPKDTQFTGDFWPTVDPYHLPGTTVEIISHTPAQRSDSMTGQSWVGGAQVSGQFGAAGMALKSPVSPSLTAKKSWFMFDNEVVCLGAGITCGDDAEIDTTAEDRRLGTSPTNKLTVNGAEFPPVMGWSNSLSNVSWCALDGVGGYYFPGGAASLQAAFVANEGGWSDITGGRRGFSSPLTDNYLKLWFNHGAKPTNATYAYVLLPNLAAGDVAAYAVHPDIVVLANTATVQAASKPSLGVVAANFWTGGNNTADLITADQPSSIITSKNPRGFAVGISDPTQTNTGVITVTLNQAARSLVSADAGVKVKRLSPAIVLTVDLNGSLGKSFQASFKL